MADIFISYSKQDPETTKALAADLEALGYTTWWDTSLLAGERFPEKIRQEIEAAKAVIVIWSEGALASQWVYAEAQTADRLGKLIPVYVPGVDLSKIPLPFGSRHMEPVTNREKLHAALGMLGTAAQSASALADRAEEAAKLDRRGTDYREGRGVPQDDAEAVRLYSKAADLGNSVAMRNLGYMYHMGRGIITPDYAEAARLYRRAADLGDLDAMSNLGVLYEYGNGVPQDYAQAANLYRKATNLGHSGAICNLGAMYDNGHGVARDYKEAIRLYLKAIELGQAGAFINLGKMYENGRGVVRDDAEAARLYRKAAGMGNTSAKQKLTDLYGEALTAAKTATTDAGAVRLFQEGAEAGESDAAFTLAMIHEEGWGVSKSRKEARRWCEKAVELGAVRLFQEGAEAGESDAAFNLAILYEEGWGVSRSRKEARRWYEKAAKLGHPKAAAAVKRLTSWF